MKEFIQNLDVYSIGGIIGVIILWIAISIFANKISSNIKKGRFTKIEDNEKEMKKFASEFVTKHKDEFVRKHYNHFYRAFLAGARWQRNRKK